jgi:hypothetical protein
LVAHWLCFVEIDGLNILITNQNLFFGLNVFDHQEQILFGPSFFVLGKLSNSSWLFFFDGAGDRNVPMNAIVVVPDCVY